MRRNANRFFVLALLVSVGVHAMLASVGSRFVYLSGFDVQHTPSAPAEIVVQLEEADEQLRPPELDPELDLGDPAGTGYATHASEGLREQLAKLAENDQASLSLDERGHGSGGDQPLRQTDVFTDAGPSADSARLPRAAAPLQVTQAAPFGVATDAQLPPRARVARAAPAVPPADALPEEPADPSGAPFVPSDGFQQQAPVEPPPSERTPQPVATNVPAPPPPPAEAPPAGQQSASADPAQKSDSESDPFASIGSVEFRESALAVRSGRQIKPRRPKLGLAGKVSLFELQTAKVVLAVSVDATGKVTSAEIVKSSGKVDIDQPTRVAMYEWWFEPKRDAAGRPVPDRFQFTINWR
jgi:TonB family protein